MQRFNGAEELRNFHYCMDRLPGTETQRAALTSHEDASKEQGAPESAAEVSPRLVLPKDILEDIVGRLPHPPPQTPKLVPGMAYFFLLASQNTSSQVGLSAAPALQASRFTARATCKSSLEFTCPRHSRKKRGTCCGLWWGRNGRITTLSTGRLTPGPLRIFCTNSALQPSAWGTGLHPGRTGTLLSLFSWDRFTTL